jgi:hypothetical protein
VAVEGGFSVVDLIIWLRIGTSGELERTKKCTFTSLKRDNFLDNT